MSENKNVVLKQPDKYYTYDDQQNADDTDKADRMRFRNQNIEVLKDAANVI